MSWTVPTENAATLQELPGGTRVGAYAIEAPLAAGGFGVVYRASQVDGGATRALKVLHAELAANPEAVARFEREVEALRRIRHPHVIEVLDHGRTDDGRPWFAMPLLRGVSLKDHLDARGSLPIDEALAILESLCAAVTAAHAGGIIHRDIKASNVFLAEDGAEAGALGPRAPRVVLLDFGVAKLLDAEGPALTTSRHVIGTLACMAPEQLLGLPVDERTDVYALGTLAYRLLTGQPPFVARSPLVVQQMHLGAPPRPPATIAPVSAAFNTPVLRALSKAREARQPTADAFLRDLLIAAGRTRAGAEVQALGVYLEAQLDPGALDDPEEEAMTDLEAILPAARAALEPLGLREVVVTGSSMLLALRTQDGPGDVDARRQVLEALRALARQLEDRLRRSVLVQVRICVHAAAARLGPDGAVTGGPITELAWVPDLVARGPLASPAALSGVDLPAREIGEAGAIRWLEIDPR